MAEKTLSMRKNRRKFIFAPDFHMLIRFKVGNFLSFRDTVDFSLIAESLRDKVATNTFSIPVGNLSLIKTAALYGANGSGKSNLIKAIEFVVSFIRNSAKEMQAEEEIPVTHFKLSTLTDNEPSFFEIELLVHDVKYRYGFKVTRQEVIAEWLFQTKKFKEYPLFDRKKAVFEIDPKFSEGLTIEERTRPNALFLSAVAQWNGRISKSILETLKKIKFFNDVLDSGDFSHTTELMEEDPIYRKAILKFLDKADLDITDIKTEALEFDTDFMRMLPPSVRKAMRAGQFTPVGKSVKTAHTKFDHNNQPVAEVYLDLASEESLGTQKLFALAGPIVEALKKGHVLIMDEFSARLHPLLSRFIVQQFNSLYNAANAQLIFASHNFALMEKELFRRDQIFLTKKEKNASEVFNLFNAPVPIRHDASFRSKYFSEDFGVKPKIGNDQLDLFTPDK
jgi:AAA15 family ATPase/GTPase